MWKWIKKLWPFIKDEITENGPNDITLTTVNHADGNKYVYIKQWTKGRLIHTDKTVWKNGKLKKV